MVHDDDYKSAKVENNDTSNILSETAPVQHQSGVGEASSEQQWCRDARPLLPRAAFFMGDLRDGLPMV